ncbi:MAG TPA: 4'-phosphopantetheinyl transferase superfamily protein, partial [Albitalea sp.]
MIELPADEVHLWWADVDDTTDSPLAERCMQLMAPEEKQQHDRFHFAKDRRRYLATRALVRSALARYAPVAPAAWAFSSSEFGRPIIRNLEAQAAGLHFNISHTDRFVVLALSRARELGVDTETIDREAPLNVASSYFSPAEIQALMQLPPHQQHLRFWELWTFKESYIKARGQGLSLPLDRFSILLPHEGMVRLEIDTALGDTASLWQLWQLRPAPT